MVRQKISNLRHRKDGFTIVELLIVIVVIGILAAITIIAYNGITTKANNANAQSNAETVQKIAEAYNADMGAYPTISQIVATWTPISGGTQSSQLPTTLKASVLPGISATPTSGLVDPTTASAVGPPATCAYTTTTATATCLTATNGTKNIIFVNKGTTGDCIGWYNYSAATPGTAWTYAGAAGSSAPTVASGVITCN